MHYCGVVGSFILSPCMAVSTAGLLVSLGAGVAMLADLQASKQPLIIAILIHFFINKFYKRTCFNFTANTFRRIIRV